MVKRCEKIQSEDGLDLYAVPLTKSPDGIVDNVSFGEAGQSKQQKTIMLIGVSDTTVKWRLINGIINNIFDVDWLDNFRFRLVGKEEAADVPVRVNHIHYMEGFRIPYSLTIIVTPDHFGRNHTSNNFFPILTHLTPFDKSRRDKSNDIRQSLCK